MHLSAPELTVLAAFMEFQAVKAVGSQSIGQICIRSDQELFAQVIPSGNLCRSHELHEAPSRSFTQDAQPSVSSG